MQRKIGDKVRIKSTLKTNEGYGDALWAEEMNCHLGEEAIITGVLYAGAYELDIDKDNEWQFSEEMLEEDTHANDK